MRFLILLLFTLVLVALLTNAISDYLNCPCKVVKITDGDIVHVLDQSRSKYKIRLGGIDAPEKKQIYGDKSTQNLTNLIAGKNVEVEYDKRDRYGRIIGKLITTARIPGTNCYSGKVLCL